MAAVPRRRCWGRSQSAKNTTFISGRTRAARPCSWMKATRRSGLANRFSRNEIIAPFLGQRSKPVNQLGAERLDVALLVDVGEPAIKAKAHGEICNIVFRDHH